MSLLKFSFAKDSNLIEAGLDEAGCGCLAGPVYASAVIWNDDPDYFLELKDTKEYKLLTEKGDSKKLTHSQREQVYDFIKDYSIDYSTGICTPKEIDRMNILNARIEAMHRAVSQLDIEPDFLLVDGNVFKSNGIPYQLIEKGDSKFISIASASIIAKVERDREMKRLNGVYPGYHLDKHKGYGTELHYEKLKELGPSSIHRRSFNLKLKKKNYL